MQLFASSKLLLLWDQFIPVIQEREKRRMSVLGRSTGRFSALDVFSIRWYL